MDDYIDVKINVFEHTGQRASIRKSLQVKMLIEEILKEFDDIGSDSADKYNLKLKGVDRPLDPNLTVNQLDIQPQDELTLGYVQQSLREMLDPADYAVLREVTTGKEFDIQWHPALIGRPSTEVNHNIMLAINMQLVPSGMTISRSHAQITFSNGSYYIEPLSTNNPTFLNGKEIPFNGYREIHNGDRISLGQHKVTLTFETRKRPSGSAKPGTSQPASQPPSQPRPPSQSYSQPPSQPRPPSQPVSSPVSQPVPEAQDRDATRIGSSSPGVSHFVLEKCTDITKIGQTIALETYPFILGRSIPLLSLEGDVSRQHAEVRFDAGSNKYFIKDLRSTNGVTINGVKIEPEAVYEIVPDTLIGFGQYVVLRFKLG
jgi:pSer/pThr/pTyr-binding forkhead associated (FHA) protein